MNRVQEGLQQLGKKTEYRMDYAPEVLESFENKHPDNDYWVQFNCPLLRLRLCISLPSVWWSRRV